MGEPGHERHRRAEPILTSRSVLVPRIRAERIIVSRTDHIGDVVLTLPMVGILRREYPSSEIVFLGRSYTAAAVEACEHVDRFLAWDDVAQSGRKAQAALLRDQRADVIIHVYPNREIAAAARVARIPTRVGTSHRSYHLWNCNKWVGFSRRRSDLHEAQLNVKLLLPFGVRSVPVARRSRQKGRHRLRPRPPVLASVPVSCRPGAS